MEEIAHDINHRTNTVFIHDGARTVEWQGLPRHVDKSRSVSITEVVDEADLPTSDCLPGTAHSIFEDSDIDSSAPKMSRTQ